MTYVVLIVIDRLAPVAWSLSAWGHLILKSRVPCQDASGKKLYDDCGDSGWRWIVTQRFLLSR